jgi:hypothetical protein
MNNEPVILDPTPRPVEDDNPAGGFIPTQVPCKIHLLNGKTFIVDKIAAWVYMEQGVFATGHFKGYSGENDILIPYNRIDYYELDFPALREHLEQEALSAGQGS